MNGNSCDVNSSASSDDRSSVSSVIHVSGIRSPSIHQANISLLPVSSVVRYLHNLFNCWTFFIQCRRWMRATIWTRRTELWRRVPTPTQSCDAPCRRATAATPRTRRSAGTWRPCRRPSDRTSWKLSATLLQLLDRRRRRKRGRSHCTRSSWVRRARVQPPHALCAICSLETRCKVNSTLHFQLVCSLTAAMDSCFTVVWFSRFDKSVRRELASLLHVESTRARICADPPRRHTCSGRSFHVTSFFHFCVHDTRQAAVKRAPAGALILFTGTNFVQPCSN